MLTTSLKLYIALAICRIRHPDSTPLFTLEAIPWDQFKEGWILPDTPSPAMSKAIEGCDIFLGGLDWTVNYL
jgi:hypothetical protein